MSNRRFNAQARFANPSTPTWPQIAAAPLCENARNDALAEAGFEVIHIRRADLWDGTALRRRLEPLRRAGLRPAPTGPVS